MKNALLVLILSSCLAGCGSTPATVEYYRISSEPPQQAPSTPSVDAKTVVLEQVELATFLSQPGLVMQSGDNTIVISKVHLWAERLDKALPRLLTTRLQQQSGRYHFFRGHADWADDPDYSLRVRIDNFQPNTNGEAYASGSFQLLDRRSGRSTMLQEFRFVRDMRRDGYAEAVALLDSLISDIAADILNELDTLQQTPPA